MSNIKLSSSYGDIKTSSFRNVKNKKIGLVMPCYKRPEYLEKTLASLKKSNLKDVIVCIIDESLEREHKNFKPVKDNGFYRYDGVDSAGYDIKQVNGNLETKMTKCKESDKAVAFNTGGWIKYKIDPHRMDKTKRNFSLYVKDNVEDIFVKDTPEDILINNKTRQIIEDFELDTPLIKIFKKKHGNMYDSLKVGWDILSNQLNCKYLMCLDSDAIVREDWISVLKNLHDSFMTPYKVITGFNTNNHKIMLSGVNYCRKQSIGGINMFFTKNVYRNNIRKFLNNTSWDYQVCEEINQSGGVLISTKPSVVQHIGEEGLWSNKNRFDVAKDF
jgi:glycosyltransferase involved in cell wall biosynthesis